MDRVSLTSEEDRLLRDANFSFGIGRYDEENSGLVRIIKGFGMQLYNPRVYAVGEDSSNIRVYPETIFENFRGKNISYDSRTNIHKLELGPQKYSLDGCPSMTKDRGRVTFTYQEKERGVEPVAEIDTVQSDIVIQADYGALVGNVYTVNDGGEPVIKNGYHVSLHDLSTILPRESNLELIAKGKRREAPALKGYVSSIVKVDRLNRPIDMKAKAITQKGIPTNWN